MHILTLYLKQNETFASKSNDPTKPEQTFNHSNSTSQTQNSQASLYYYNNFFIVIKRHSSSSSYFDYNKQHKFYLEIL